MRVLHAGVKVALVVLLAGCTGQGQGKQVVSFWAMGREAEVVGELLPAFEKEHPEIEIRVQQIPWTAAHEKLLTAFAADDLPDVCQLGNTWLAEFASLKSLEPLQSRIDASSVVKQVDYFPGIWDTNVVEGEVVGVPWYVDTRLLFYRKDLVAQAGVKLPINTWADWETAMAQVKALVGKDRFATLMPINEFEQQLSFGLQMDDPLLKEHDTRGNFSSPGFRKALGFYANMFKQGWAPAVSETQISNVWEEFFNGYYVFYVSGPWNIREFRKVAPEGLKDAWGTMPLPGPDGPGSGIAGGTSLVIFRDSERKEAAWKFIEFMSRPEIQERFHGIIGDLPPRRSTWEFPSLANDPLAQPFREQLERAKPTPKVLEWERVMQEMRLETERVVRGGKAQDAATRDLDARVDELLEKRRWMHARDHDRSAAGKAAAP
ncbi:MAG: sugar ABC transporter substrate-binding protein [Pseudoxanthomonas sp.]